MTASASNRRQAPRGATSIENPVGTAPALAVEHGDQTVVTLPGVPRGAAPLEGEVRSRLAPAAGQCLTSALVLPGLDAARRLGLQVGGETIEERAGRLAAAVARWAGVAVGAAVLVEAVDEPASATVAGGVSLDGESRARTWRLGGDAASARLRAAVLVPRPPAPDAARGLTPAGGVGPAGSTPGRGRPAARGAGLQSAAWASGPASGASGRETVIAVPRPTALSLADTTLCSPSGPAGAGGARRGSGRLHCSLRRRRDPDSATRR